MVDLPDLGVRCGDGGRYCGFCTGARRAGELRGVVAARLDGASVCGYRNG